MKNANDITKNGMRELNIFLDSSALIAGIVSPNGASRVLLVLAEGDILRITISEQVVAESERAIARKAPRALADLRLAILASKAVIVRDPTEAEVAAQLQLISHATDVPILLAAMKARVDYLVTLNRKHFIDDASVAARSGLRIGNPGDALRWVKEQLG